MRMKNILLIGTLAVLAWAFAYALHAPVPSFIGGAKAEGFYDPFHTTQRRKVVYRKKARRRPREEDLRYYAPPEDYWDEPQVRCRPEKVEVVSTEHTNVDNAKEAGRKILMATIQWRYGGAYMDLTLAEDFREHCGPSNAMDTATGRLSEAANKLVGQDGQNVRCVIRARPCRAKLSTVEGHR
jgi:hypothetical protein